MPGNNGMGAILSLLDVDFLDQRARLGPVPGLDFFREFERIGPGFPEFLVAGGQNRALDAGLDSVGEGAVADEALVHADLFGLISRLASVAEDLFRIVFDAELLFPSPFFMDELFRFHVIFQGCLVQLARLRAGNAAIGELLQIYGLSFRVLLFLEESSGGQMPVPGQ